MGGYKGFEVPADFKSDGCTVPWFLFFLAPFMWGFEASCRWHDWARRHLVHHEILTVEEADLLWSNYMEDLVSARMWLYRVTLGKLVPRVALAVVERTRGKYKRTFAVPYQWEPYLTHKG